MVILKFMWQVGILLLLCGPILTKGHLRNVKREEISVEARKAQTTCGPTTVDEWIIIGDSTCFCRKICIIVFCKYKLVDCQPLMKTTTTPRPPTVSTIATATTASPSSCSVDPRVDFTWETNTGEADLFRFYHTSNGVIPEWVLRNDGTPLAKHISNSLPTAQILKQIVGGVDIEGTFVMAEDDDLVGIVFSFMSPTTFYLMSWKGFEQGVSRPGITIQLINSTDGLSGESDELLNALSTRVDVAGQAKTIYEAGISWAPHISYRWIISHRPKFGLIRLRVYENESIPLIDSGCVKEGSLRGGRFGAYAAAQVVNFTTVGFRCNSVIQC